jgi:radical SAM protein with 4Fe4S-binding SPASM domain
MIEREVVIWDITSRCNLKCKHCYNAEKYDETTFNLSFEDCVQAVDEISEAGFEQIQFVGGEPLMAENFISIVDYIISKDLRVSLTTNGWFLDQFGIDLVNLGVSSIFVSIDGTTKEINDAVRGNGTFQRVIKNFKDLAQYIKKHDSNTILGISYTITKKNFSDLPNILKFAVELNAGGIFLSFLSHEGRARDNWNEISSPVDKTLKILELLIKNCYDYSPIKILIESRPLLVEYFNKKYGINIETSLPYLKCTGGSRNISILADGTVLPCGVCGSNLGYEQDHMFERENLNIRTHSLKEILASKFLITFRNFVESPTTYNIRECKTCHFRNVCAPCPLVFHNNDGKEMSIEECRWVKTQMDQLYLDILYSVPMKKKEFFIEEGAIITIYGKKDAFILEGTGPLIWKAINGIKTTEEIISSLSLQFNDINRHVIYYDVIDFILRLSNLKIINLKKIEKKIYLKNQFILRKERFGGILYDKINNQMIFMDPLTYEILELCDGAFDVQEIIQKISSVHKVTSDKCRKFLESYIDMGYLEEIMWDQLLHC